MCAHVCVSVSGGFWVLRLLLLRGWYRAVSFLRHFRPWRPFLGP